MNNLELAGQEVDFARREVIKDTLSLLAKIDFELDMESTPSMRRIKLEEAKKMAEYNLQQLRVGDLISDEVDNGKQA